MIVSLILTTHRDYQLRNLTVHPQTDSIRPRLHLLVVRPVHERKMDEKKIREAIEEARHLVSGEEEPWRLAAFQVILSKLLEQTGLEKTAGSNRIADKLTQNEVYSAVPTIFVPDKLIGSILKLSERDRIPFLWSFSNEESMTVDEFLNSAKMAGFSFSRSWSPLEGGNFRNRLVREGNLFVESGKMGKVPLYKLSAAGKMKVGWIREKFQSEENGK